MCVCMYLTLAYLGVFFCSTGCFLYSMLYLSIANLMKTTICLHYLHHKLDKRKTSF